MTSTFTLPYPPSANRYWRNFHGRMVISAEALAYKQKVSEITDEADPPCLTCNVVMHVLVYRPQKRGDLDNTLKILFDSLSGIAYKDDSQIIAIHAYRHDDKDNPRVVVTVEAVQ